MKNSNNLANFSNILYQYKQHLILIFLSILLNSSIIVFLAKSLGAFIDTIKNTNNDFSFYTIIIASIILILSAFLRVSISNFIGIVIAKDVKQQLLSYIVKRDQHFFEKNTKAKIISIASEDIATIKAIIATTLPIALRSIITATGCILMLFIENYKLSLIFFLTIPLIYIFLHNIINKVKNLSKMLNNEDISINKCFIEIINNIKTLQSLNAEKLYINKLSSIYDIKLKMAKKYSLYKGIMISFIMFTAIIVITFMIYLGIIEVKNNNMTVGELTSFYTYFILFISTISNIEEVYSNTQLLLNAISRIYGLYEKPSNKPAKIINNNFLNKDLNIKINHLTFYYTSRPTLPSLYDINLEIITGEQVAFVGHSGAGKTTIFNILLGFYKIKNNMILVNNNDINLIHKKDIRNICGVVEQEPALFTDTIENNIKIGYTDANYEEIEKAAKNAYIYDFIQSLPNKMQTCVGEEGIKLSTGQKQRIAIARAIIKNPKLLLLDEATSALDSESEKYVKEFLYTFCKEKTSIVIAHRLSTIIDSDRIILFENGKILATGTHNSLLKTNKKYREHCEIQFSSKK